MKKCQVPYESLSYKDPIGKIQTSVNFLKNVWHHEAAIHTRVLCINTTDWVKPAASYQKRPKFIFQIFLFPFWDCLILAPKGASPKKGGKILKK